MTTTLKIDENSINYYRKEEGKNREIRGYMIYLLCCIILFGSTVVFLLYLMEWEPLIQLTILKRIKNNVQGWIKLITEKTAIESNKGRILSLQLPISVYDFDCYDIGLAYVALRLNRTSFLPEFIMRGVGDVWNFRKASEIDKSAEQFCRFIIMTDSSNIQTCGISMFNSLGYSGYFENNHPCSNALDILKTSSINGPNSLG